MLRIIFISILCIGFVSCSIIRDTPKYSFSDGIYTSQQTKVYVNNMDDSIYVYPLSSKTNSFLYDSVQRKRTAFPQKKSVIRIPSQKFNQASFDIDFLTIPFKFRSAVKSLPAQFNTNLNGAVYLGYRNDAYRLWYKKSPLNDYNKKTTHYGFSFGLFTGLGGTAMNPWVTENQVAAEYDGVVWSKGIAAIIGIDNFTVGITAGWDHLLDKNKKYWIYQGRQWFGLAFGLNLN